MMVKVFALWFTLGSATGAFAQTQSPPDSAPMSLHEAIDAAHGDSPDVKRSGAAKEEARWKKIEAFSTYLPSVSAGGDRLLDKKYAFTDLVFDGAPISIPNIVPTTSFTLGVEWSLFDGFAGTNRYRAAGYFASAANDQHAWTEFKTSRTVTLDYYRALAAKTLADVAENNWTTLKDHLRDVKLLRGSGLSTNYDVLRVEVQVSEAESELLNARDNLELAKSKLGETLGREQAVVPAGHLPDLKAEIVDKMGAEPFHQRADLAAMGARVEGYTRQEMAANRHWVPRLSAYGNYLYYNNRNDKPTDWDNYRNSYMIGLSLKWNLFDGLQSTAHDREATQQKIQAESALRSERLKARQDVNMWTRKYKYFISVTESRQDDVGKSKEAVRLAREGRRVGARTNTDLLDAESDLYRAQAGAITAQLGAIEALINVELATGQQLFIFE